MNTEQKIALVEAMKVALGIPDVGLAEDDQEYRDFTYAEITFSQSRPTTTPETTPVIGGVDIRSFSVEMVEVQIVAMLSAEANTLADRAAAVLFASVPDLDPLAEAGVGVIECNPIRDLETETDGGRVLSCAILELTLSVRVDVQIRSEASGYIIEAMEITPPFGGPFTVEKE